MALNIERVLISDDIDSQCIEILIAASVIADKKTKLSEDELVSLIPVSPFTSCGIPIIDQFVRGC